MVPPHGLEPRTYYYETVANVALAKVRITGVIVLINGG